jgi:hypothetical protein
MSSQRPKTFLRSQANHDAAFPAVTADDYKSCYNPLYALIKSRELDFAAVAAAIKYPERRVRDVLMKRLGSGEVLRLMDHQAGWCYLCQSKVEVDREPICFACLRKICRSVLQEGESDAEAPKRYGFQAPNAQ